MKRTSFIILLCLTVLLHLPGRAQEPYSWGDWERWGQQPDSTYLNPVIPADFSDLDCIRVGDDYYAITSTFQFSPGVTIIHSRDLVNWEYCGHAVPDLTQIGPELGHDRMNRYGRGIWAGSIRYHQGRFYLFFGTPDEGFFMTSAPSAEGPWEPLTVLLAEPGWDDCSAIWDEDGNGYFVGTCFKDGYKTYIFRMRADGRSIDRDSAVLVNSGSGREANKLIRHGAYYYLVFSESSGRGRYVLAKRSRNIMGPYQEERQLAHPSREAREPNQGGIVEGPDGKWYFFTHHGTGDWGGRIASLLPVTWTGDWPIIGEIQPDGLGAMQWRGGMPALTEEVLRLTRSDDFDSGTVAPQWQWNYQPRDEMFSLSERPGWLRLKAFRPLREDDLMSAGNTLTQRTFHSQYNDVTIKLDLDGLTPGQHAGLCHFSKEHAALGVEYIQDGDEGIFLEFRKNGSVVRGPRISSRYLWLKSRWGNDGVSHFYFSVDGDEFTAFGQEYQMKFGSYRGDRIGIYTYNNQEEAGYVDVDYLHYRME